MTRYVFYDTDVTGKEEYDIGGQDYATLIKICCKYCSTLSFRVSHTDTSFVEKLERFAVNRNNELHNVYEHYYGNNPKDNELIEIRYYKVNKELEEFLLSASNSVFDWIYGWGHTNPEDLAFYREDGSLFFYSTAHEGVCVLTPNANETVDEIVSNGLWQKS